MFRDWHTFDTHAILQKNALPKCTSLTQQNLRPTNKRSTNIINKTDAINWKQHHCNTTFSYTSLSSSSSSWLLDCVNNPRVAWLYTITRQIPILPPLVKMCKSPRIRWPPSWPLPGMRWKIVAVMTTAVASIISVKSCFLTTQTTTMSGFASLQPNLRPIPISFTIKMTAI